MSAYFMLHDLHRAEIHFTFIRNIFYDSILRERSQIYEFYSHGGRKCSRSTVMIHNDKFGAMVMSPEHLRSASATHSWWMKAGIWYKVILSSNLSVWDVLSVYKKLQLEKCRTEYYAEFVKKLFFKSEPITRFQSTLFLLYVCEIRWMNWILFSLINKSYV